MKTPLAIIIQHNIATLIIEITLCFYTAPFSSKFLFKWFVILVNLQLSTCS